MDIDLSSCANIAFVFLNNNNLSSLNLKNGNNTSIFSYNSINNSNLNCVQVDDVTYSSSNWTDVDSGHYLVKIVLYQDVRIL